MLRIEIEIKFAKDVQFVQLDFYSSNFQMKSAFSGFMVDSL